MKSKFDEISKKSEFLERTLISALVQFPEKIKNLLSVISFEDFQSKHGDVFRIIYDAHFVDEFVGTALYNKGINMSDYLLVETVTTSEILSLAKQVKKHSFAYKLSGLLERTMIDLEAEKIEEDYVEFHDKLIKLGSGKSEETWDVKSVVSEFENEQELQSKRRQEGEPYIGFSSGFEDIDRVVDGLRSGHLWIVGGYTSSGKTFCALNIVHEVLKQGKRAVFLSLEMSKIQIVSRLVGIIAGVNATEALKGTVFPDELQKIQEAKGFLRGSDFAIYNEMNQMDRIKATMYEQMYRKKVDLFVLDYLQLVSSAKSKTEYETMRDCVKEFQQIAHKLKVPIILLSQISNEAARAGNSPVMGFKGAGDIAAAADLAIEFQSDEIDPEERHRKIREGIPVDVKAVIKKNRHGRTGSALLTFDGSTGRFKKRMFKKQVPNTNYEHKRQNNDNNDI